MGFSGIDSIAVSAFNRSFLFFLFAAFLFLSFLFFLFLCEFLFSRQPVENDWHRSDTLYGALEESFASLARGDAVMETRSYIPANETQSLRRVVVLKLSLRQNKRKIAINQSANNERH